MIQCEGFSAVATPVAEELLSGFEPAMSFG